MIAANGVVVDGILVMLLQYGGALEVLFLERRWWLGHCLAIPWKV